MLNNKFIKKRCIIKYVVTRKSNLFMIWQISVVCPKNLYSCLEELWIQTSLCLSSCSQKCLFSSDAIFAVLENYRTLDYMDQKTVRKNNSTVIRCVGILKINYSILNFIRTRNSVDIR